MKYPAALACGLALAVAACASLAMRPSGAPSAAQAPAAKQEPEWLATMNRYRRADGLLPVVEDPDLGAADLNHARYLVKNHVTCSAGAGMHSEDKSNRWYTSSGYWAAQTGDVVIATNEISESAAIERWISAPFHGLAILAPDLRSSGFGSYCEGNWCAAVSSIGHPQELRGVAKVRQRDVFDYDSDAPEKANRVELETPVRWPAPGMMLSSGAFADREWPDPLTACKGYKPPTGAVIFASFGRGFAAKPQSEELTCDGAPVEHCVVTADNYANPDPKTQEHARRLLANDAAVLLIPRAPIKPGANCEVFLTVEGDESRWSFGVRPQRAEPDNGKPS